MRSGHVHNVRESTDCRFHDVEFAEHRRCKDVHARIMLEQEFSDIAATHVRRSAQSRFEISLTPVNGPVNQIWFFGQHCFYRREISVPGNNEALYASAIELRMVLGEVGYVIG